MPHQVCHAVRPLQRNTFIALCMWGIHRVPLALLGLQMSTPKFLSESIELSFRLATVVVGFLNWMQEIIDYRS
ncbi:unnamed protein product [Merluccius merluccius]